MYNEFVLSSHSLSAYLPKCSQSTAMEAAGVQRCALRLGSQDGVNKLMRVVEHKHVCAHCGEVGWVAEGVEVAHVCDERRIRAREHADAVLRRLVAVRDGIEDARMLTSECIKLVRAQEC